ncbi:MAG: SIMPL domain-containing protein [Thermocladium sp.]
MTGLGMAGKTLIMATILVAAAIIASIYMYYLNVMRTPQWTAPSYINIPNTTQQKAVAGLNPTSTNQLLTTQEPSSNSTGVSLIDENGTTITVVGQATVNLPAKGIVIYITISNAQISPTPSQAYQEMVNNLDQFMAILNELGINYTTLGVSLNPVYSQQYGTQQVEGYSASYELKIIMMNPINQSLISELLSNASKYGGIEVSISAFINRSEYQEASIKAIGAAVQVAMDKIYEAATTLGYSRIHVISIQENAYPIYGPTPYLYAMEAGPSQSVPINPSSASVTATVTIEAVMN